MKRPVLFRPLCILGYIVNAIVLAISIIGVSTADLFLMILSTIGFLIAIASIVFIGLLQRKKHFALWGSRVCLWFHILPGGSIVVANIIDIVRYGLGSSVSLFLNVALISFCCLYIMGSIFLCIYWGRGVHGKYLKEYVSCS